MDRPVFKIGHVGVILNDEHHPMIQRLLSLSISTIIINRNSKTLIVLLLLIIQSAVVDCLVCYDGADCLQTRSCNECNGVGCIRMKSYNTERIHTIALTCLPYATRIYQLEPAGCRISSSGDSEHCICYDNDYCNHADGSSLFSFKSISLTILAVVVSVAFTLSHLL